MTLGLSILFIFVMLLLSAFFSGSETAMTATSKARMHALEKEGNKRAALVNKIGSRKDKMIGALLLGNNFVNIMSSALATSVFLALVGPAGVIYATIVMTALILIFAEVMPKTYALHHADKMSMALAPVIKVVIFVLAPLTEMVAHIVRFSLKILGADISVVNVGDHREMLRGAIELHRGPEIETGEQRAMLRSILDLADVEVGEVMTHRRNIEMIDASKPLSEIVDDVLKSSYTRMPLWRDNPDNIVGIIHAKALLKEMQAARGNIDTLDLDVLASEPWFVPDTTSLSDQLKAFRHRREHFALVVDEYGSLMGIVTLEDILEEIVGDIDDEMDETVTGVRKLMNGSYLIDGTVTIRDLNRDYEWDFPDDEDYSTLAGLVLHESQMIPDVGQIFNFFGFTFEVVRRQRNQITLIRVTPPKKAAP